MPSHTLQSKISCAPLFPHQEAKCEMMCTGSKGLAMSYASRCSGSGFPSRSQPRFLLMDTDTWHVTIPASLDPAVTYRVRGASPTAGVLWHPSCLFHSLLNGVMGDHLLRQRSGPRHAMFGNCLLDPAARIWCRTGRNIWLMAGVNHTTKRQALAVVTV